MLTPDLGNKTDGRFSDILNRFIRGAGVERRGQKYHRERLGEALREEIETILEGELGDPRIGLVNVSSVLLAEDGRSARVLVTVEGDDEEARRTLEGLTAAVGYVRREVGGRLHLRRAPELFFQLDRSQTYAARIDELLDRTKRQSAVGSRRSSAKQGE
ncbi:MAG TPA: 30S ribosome-binding factor RbfA [Terriglobales bacterium]|nr:30S ribosome-binding factor RbfA [Terriglobales bacterium]